MMVSQLITTNQSENMTRQQRRQLESEYQKKLRSLQRQNSGCNLPISFDNQSITVFGNFGLLEAFKQAIDFRGMLSQVHLDRYHNCQYTDAALLDTVINAISLGLIRFSHMNALQTDPIKRVPDESTLRNFLGRIVDQKALDKLAQVNQALLALKEN